MKRSDNAMILIIAFIVSAMLASALENATFVTYLILFVWCVVILFLGRRALKL